MKATLPGGKLNTLNNQCYISVPTDDSYAPYYDIHLKILPEITDSKQARYADEAVIGRSSPVKTYSNSENRIISMRLQFQTVTQSDLWDNIKALWALESATYPRKGIDGPYRPPPVCKIRCGYLLGVRPLCVVLDSYSVQIPTDCVWDENLLVPYYFYVSTNWHVVYAAARMPSQDRILNIGV